MTENKSKVKLHDLPCYLKMMHQLSLFTIPRQGKNGCLNFGIETKLGAEGYTFLFIYFWVGNWACRIFLSHVVHCFEFLLSHSWNCCFFGRLSSCTLMLLLSIYSFVFCFWLDAMVGSEARGVWPGNWRNGCGQDDRVSRDWQRGPPQEEGLHQREWRAPCCLAIRMFTLSSIGISFLSSTLLDLSAIEWIFLWPLPFGSEVAGLQNLLLLRICT